MSHFDTPAGAIRQTSELTVGLTVWQVYGIYTPFLGGSLVIKTAPHPFREHPSYDPVNSSHADHLVFDGEHERGWTAMHFATDCNLDGYSHNDNYLFPSKELADAAVEWLRKQYEARPDIVADEKRWDELLDDYDYPESYANA